MPHIARLLCPLDYSFVILTRHRHSLDLTDLYRFNGWNSTNLLPFLLLYIFIKLAFWNFWHITEKCCRLICILKGRVYPALVSLVLVASRSWFCNWLFQTPSTIGYIPYLPALILTEMCLWKIMWFSEHILCMGWYQNHTIFIELCSCQRF